MNWLAESPWPAITVGVVLELGLAIALVRTGRGVLLAAIGLVLLATIGMVALERVMVTETEEVEDALADVEAALESNDAERVLALFSASSRRRAEVESALARFRVRDARIGRDLELVINQLTNPPSARAYFTGRLDAEDTRREVPYETLILKFRVTLSREGERWLIDDYAVQDQFSQNWTRGRVEDR